MKLALYLGCLIQTEQYGYEISAREVLPKLGIKLVDLEGASCCGFELRSINTLGWAYLSARNLALAERLGLDVLALCNGCNLSLCEVKHQLEADPELKSLINPVLAIEGLKYEGNVEVIHTLEVLHGAVGVDKIKRLVRNPLKGLKLAAHYGCHAIRPSKLGRPDDPEDPTKLDDLVEALGAESMDYPEKLDCCSADLAMFSGKMALSIAGLKLKAIQEYEFDGMVMICPFCMKIFDSRQRAIKGLMKDKTMNVPVLYYTQLLGLAMGIGAEKLGLDLNLSPVDRLLTKIEEGEM